MTKEVLYVVTVLLSHQIDDVKSVNSPNNGQHDFLGPYLLLRLLRDIISRYAIFRRMMEFQSEPILVLGYKYLKLIFSRSVRMDYNPRQVPIRICRRLVVNSCGIQRKCKLSYQAIPANDSSSLSGKHI
jgi:hypothetical protein